MPWPTSSFLREVASASVFKIKLNAFWDTLIQVLDNKNKKVWGDFSDISAKTETLEVAS